MSAARVRRTRSTFLTVLVGAVVVVLFGTGTAVAGSLITSTRIKNDTIRSIDVRNDNLRGIDVRDGSLTGKELADSSLTGADVKDSSLTNADVGVYFAQVWRDGTVASSSGGVTAKKIPSSTGKYEVDFGRDIRQCAVTGTIGDPEGAPFGYVQTASGVVGNPEAVYVATVDPLSAPDNLEFHLVVVC